MENTNIKRFWKENIEKIKKIFGFYIGNEIFIKLKFVEELMKILIVWLERGMILVIDTKEY